MEEKLIVTFNENKIKEKYTQHFKEFCTECNGQCFDYNLEDNIECMKKKWDINRNDWEQGFDSDCAIHCCQRDICFQIFKNKECTNIE